MVPQSSLLTMKLYLIAMLLTAARSGTNSRQMRTDCSLAELEACRRHVPNGASGPVTAEKCSQMEVYLSCLESVADRCADLVDDLPFDLRGTIEGIRSMCPSDSVRPALEQDCANGRRSCYDLLTVQGGDYSQKANNHVNCIKNLIARCKDMQHWTPEYL